QRTSPWSTASSVSWSLSPLSYSSSPLSVTLNAIYQNRLRPRRGGSGAFRGRYFMMSPGKRLRIRRGGSGWEEGWGRLRRPCIPTSELSVGLPAPPPNSPQAGRADPWYSRGDPLRSPWRLGHDATCLKVVHMDGDSSRSCARFLLLPGRRKRPLKQPTTVRHVGVRTQPHPRMKAALPSSPTYPKLATPLST